MFEKTAEFKIDANDIFKNDKLERKGQIKDLSKLVESCNQPLVLGINASWGAGKTTFIKLWKAYLEKEMNINSIHFSAWEDDFSNEPLISILGEFKSYINKNFSADPKVEAKFEKVKNTTEKVLKRGIPAFIKGSTAGFLDIDNGFESAASAITEVTAKELIDNYSKDKDITLEFKKTVFELIEKIDDNKPFIIFIDELDRCRPLYSIELLERIKHLFGIKNLVFILSIDKEQLSESIKSQYGNINTDAYLKRFIDLEYKLQNNNLELYCDYLYNKYDLKNKLTLKEIQISLSEYDSLHYFSLLKNLVKILSLSLRDIEQIFIKLNIIFQTLPQRFKEVHLRVFILFEILKTFNSKLYYDFIHKGENKEYFRKLLLNKIDHNESFYRSIDLFIEIVILSTNLSDIDFRQMINEKTDSLASRNDTKSELYKRESLIIKQLNIYYDEWQDYYMNNLIYTVIKKIEFVDRFNFD